MSFTQDQGASNFSSPAGHQYSSITADGHGPVHAGDNYGQISHLTVNLDGSKANIETLRLLLSRLTDDAWILPKDSPLRALAEIPWWNLSARIQCLKGSPELFEERSVRTSNLGLLNRQAVEFDALDMWKEFNACCQTIALIRRVSYYPPGTDEDVFLSISQDTGTVLSEMDEVRLQIRGIARSMTGRAQHYVPPYEGSGLHKTT